VRVEIRKSGGPTCEACGAHEIVQVPEGPLEKDVLALLEEANAQLERDCVAKFEEKADELRFDAMTRVDRCVTNFRVELLAHFQKQNDELAEGVLAFVEPNARKYRLLKRRWQRKMAAEMAVAVDELRAKTRLA
jgi:hypothetical protein